jgi:phosphate acyltransferase
VRDTDAGKRGKKRRVAVDAMGGEHSPVAEIEGAVAAVRARGIPIVLVGDQPRIRGELARLGIAASDPLLEVRHTTEVITMDDHPGQAVRRKKDASLRVCFDLARAGEVDALVSAGNSGAFLACGLFVMKRLPGVDRPGILASFPSLQGKVAVLDVGANVDVTKPEILVQFAVMAAAFARTLYGKQRPRVALLSNGEEAHKGSLLTRAVHDILSRAAELPADFEYVGYCEGNDIFKAPLDVVVTDGFTGNVILKTTEGIAEALFDLIRQELTATLPRKLLAGLLKPAFKAIKLRTDWAESGGAPLLGVDGVAVLCHGRSSARALENAIYMASDLAEVDLRPALTAAIAHHSPLYTGPRSLDAREPSETQEPQEEDSA